LRLADALGAGEAVRGVAAQGDEVGHELGPDAVALAHLLRPHLGEALARLLHQHVHLVGDALEHVAVAGEDQRAAAPALLGERERVHEVVGLEPVVVEHGPAERLPERPRLRPLDREAVGHRRAVGVVGGVGLGAVGGGLGAEAVHDRARLVLLDHLEHRVGRAQQRVDGPAVGPRDRVGEREERSVEQVGGVGDEEWTGHESATYTP